MHLHYPVVCTFVVRENFLLFFPASYVSVAWHYSFMSIPFSLTVQVCYYGQHYHCFAYSHEHDRWIMYDDTNVKVSYLLLLCKFLLALSRACYIKISVQIEIPAILFPTYR